MVREVGLDLRCVVGDGWGSGGIAIAHRGGNEGREERDKDA